MHHTESLFGGSSENWGKKKFTIVSSCVLWSISGEFPEPNDRYLRYEEGEAE